MHTLIPIMPTQRTSRTLQQQKQGFTIVELVVVIVVIAILAAITIVAYNGVTSRARASAAQLAAKQAYTKIQSTSTMNESGNFPGTLSSLDIRSGNGTSYQYLVNNSASPRTFCVTVTATDVSYFVSESQSVPKAGACDGHGANGAPTIRNIVRNPQFRSSGPADYSYSSAGAGRDSTSGYGGRVTTMPAGTVSLVSFKSTTTPTSSPLTIVASPNDDDGYTVSDGQRYTASIYMRSSCDLNSGFRLDVTGGGSTISSSPTEKASVNAWRRMSTTFTVPDGVTKISLRASFSGPQSCPSDALYLATGAMITSGSTLYEFADGSYGGWAWIGDANASVSSGPPL